MAYQVELHLRRLRQDVAKKRAAAQALSRRRTASSEQVLNARRQLLAALEEYASTVERHGWPVPPSIRRDMYLMRSLCGLPLP